MIAGTLLLVSGRTSSWSLIILLVPGTCLPVSKRTPPWSLERPSDAWNITTYIASNHCSRPRRIVSNSFRVI